MANKPEDQKLDNQELRSKELANKQKINHSWRALPQNKANEIELGQLKEALGNLYKIGKHKPFVEDEKKSNRQYQYIKVIKKKEKGKDEEKREVEEHVLDFYRYGGGGEAIELQLRPVENPKSRDEQDKSFIEAFEEFATARFHAAKQQEDHSSIYLLKQVQPARLHREAIKSLLIDATFTNERYGKVHYKGNEYWWNGQEVEKKPLQSQEAGTASAKLFSVKPQNPDESNEEMVTSVDVSDEDDDSSADVSPA